MDMKDSTNIFCQEWLQDFLVNFLNNQNLCHDLACMKHGCGGLEFHNGVLVALSGATGEPVALRMSSLAKENYKILDIDQKRGELIVHGLAFVHPWGDEYTEKLTHAVMRILYHAYPKAGHDAMMRSALSGTWSGGVLNRMILHYEASIRRQEMHNRTQEIHVENKSKNRLIRAEKHTERLLKKELRDKSRLRSRTKEKI